MSRVVESGCEHHVTAWDDAKDCLYCRQCGQMLPNGTDQ